MVRALTTGIASLAIAALSGKKFPVGRFSAMASSAMDCTDNPLLGDWSAEPFHLPPFQSIEAEHFKPAFEVAMSQHMKELQSIVDSEEPPSFESVVVPYERAGGLLSRIGAVFGNYCNSLNSPALAPVQTEMAPILSNHSSKVVTTPGLFEKLEKVHKIRHHLDLNNEQIRLVERIHTDFVRSGAKFDDVSKREYAKIKMELASLQTAFQQNVMKDEETYKMVLNKSDLEGCPSGLTAAAKQAAIERNLESDKYVITLSRSLVQPFLTFSERRDLRKEIWEAWTNRGQLDPERDNVKIAVDILKLRKRLAEYHGCKTFAEYQCQDRMAKSPENVLNLLNNVWDRAKISANREREALEKFVAETGHELEDGIQPWDWRFYAEKVRKDMYDFDESLLKPYLSLDKITKAAMSVSNSLFGLNYHKRTDIQSYHSDVDTYEVRKQLADGTESLAAIFIHDNFARPHKASGAWMSEYRTQKKVVSAEDDSITKIPIVSNNNNFAKGEETLLSFDDVITLFHEFGHAHHGMLSNATYEYLASTNVLRDFVELPSQLLENWIKEPEILKRYATHHETNEPIPDALLEKLKKAEKFNQGFAVVEYTSCALVDMALHQIEDYSDFDLLQFEKEQLEKLDMPRGIVMRHRPPHFQHLFSTSGYAAGYYVYQWAEVLDADAFAAFKETGNLFDPATAEKALKYIYSAGNTEAPDELFRSFRGRDPDVSFMLARKGLLDDAKL
mmetsp:Transcript_17814/g.21633  ORF Transcript_17814/g.21633 Transcript_17814/m.21633 type:complete len:731 (-) Transcript_17814:266-2458(-)|eukprot:CAMPEP_0184012820 /NCGR_PEP_ID=MMETSP0954-20121128/4653_1 /TAXON_ID=627963 /ORGANISM="Aplanochytrium sp, Strain PBS07" /LENGTH=730 /DNA_ID=CAMNT_0026292907 /DNA_START=34 /DNA_END=2226 /DNA_ORIENTATION=+